jgi:hypothetical protein
MRCIPLLAVSLLLCVPAMADPGEGEKEECDNAVENCIEEYAPETDGYRTSGCKGAPPRKPEIYLAARHPDCDLALKSCGEPSAKDVRQMTGHLYRQAMEKCAGTSGGTKSDPLVETVLNATQEITGGKKTVPVPAKPKKVFFDFTFRVFLSSRQECLEKEAKARAGRKEATIGNAVDDYTLYCSRFYPLSEGIEGEKGNNPIEISNRLGEAEKAGLKFGKTKATLAFETVEQCVAEIRRLDILYGNIVMFFAPFSKDLKVVCEAIRDDTLSLLWQLKTGPKPQSVTGVRR